MGMSVHCRPSTRFCWDTATALTRVSPAAAFGLQSELGSGGRRSRTPEADTSCVASYRGRHRPEGVWARPRRPAALTAPASEAASGCLFGPNGHGTWGGRRVVGAVHSEGSCLRHGSAWTRVPLCALQLRDCRLSNLSSLLVFVEITAFLTSSFLTRDHGKIVLLYLLKDGRTR